MIRPLLLIPCALTAALTFGQSPVALELETFATGLRKTVRWYLDNQPWVGRVLSGEYKEWITANYAAR